jgi:NAD(P)-dependent dehydrogenase (short-subunit alcohol dehydrogenase family)
MLHEHTVKGGIDFDTLNDDSMSDPHTRYGRSKLSSILFGKALARRLAGEKVFVNIAHPGFVSTAMTDPENGSFGKVGKAIFGMLVKAFAVRPDEGALTQLYLATSPEIENKAVTGKYFVPIAHEIQPSKYGRDELLQEKLWSWSEETVRQHTKMQ